MPNPEPFIPLDSIRSLALRRDLDRMARELLETKREIADYLDPLKDILDPLEKKKSALQAQINDTAQKIAKLDPRNRRVLADGWKMYYRRGRTEISESRLLERGVDIEDVNAAKVEKGGTYIVESIESQEEEK